MTEGKTQAMTFTDSQLTQFRSQGYITVPDFWTAREVAAMQAELERLKQDGLLANVATEGDGKTGGESQSQFANLSGLPAQRSFPGDAVCAQSD